MKTSGIFLAASAAVAFFCASAGARENVLPALSAAKPETAAIKTGLQSKTTAQAEAQSREYSDYDALSAVNDPLYREGSREFLQQVARQGAAVKEESRPSVKPALRDAPNSRLRAVPAQGLPAPHPAIKKPVKKSGPVDPVRVKNTL